MQPVDKMSNFETIRGMLNIVQAVEFVMPNAEDPEIVKDVLLKVQARAMKIYQNTLKVKFVPGVKGVLSPFINETFYKFERIQNEIMVIQERTVNHSTSGSDLESTSTHAQLKEILYCLHRKERYVKLGIIAKMDSGPGSCEKKEPDGIVMILSQLSTQS